MQVLVHVNAPMVVYMLMMNSSISRMPGRGGDGSQRHFKTEQCLKARVRGPFCQSRWKILAFGFRAMDFPETT